MTEKFQNKVEYIENIIIDMMKRGELPPTGKLPSLNKLAKRYDVSRSTVYQAFRKLEENGLIDIVGGKGAFAKEHFILKKKLIRDNCISFIIPNMADTFISEMVRGVETVVSKENCYLAIFDSLDDFREERENIEKAIELHSKGILLFPVTHVHPFCPNYDIYIQTMKKGIPLVFMDNYPLNLDVDYVVGDDFQGIYNITSYLIKMGHRRIAFFGGPTHISSIYNRYQGYLQAMTDAGVEIDPALVFPRPNTPITNGSIRISDFTIKYGPQHLQNILEVNYNVTAIVFISLPPCYIDTIKTSGLKIPEDMSICTLASDYREELFRHLNIGNYISNYLTVTDFIDITYSTQSTYALGVRAAEVIIKKIQEPQKHFKEKVPMPIHIGNSVKQMGKRVKNKKESTTKL